jgi:hypothetical protein
MKIHLAILLILTGASLANAQPLPAQDHPLKNFSDIIPAGTRADTGLFNVYKVGGKYFFDVPDSLLGREMMVITHLVSTPGNIHVQMHEYGGEQENTQIWKWEKHGHQLLIRVPAFFSKADSGTAMYQAVRNSNLPVILASFNILADDERHTGALIDVTDFYNGDITAIGISDDLKKEYKIGTLDADRSYMDTVKTYPINIEAQTTKTYHSTLSPTDNTNASITFRLNTSMLLLPKHPMKARLYDDRVSYIDQDQIDYGLDAQQAEVTSYIHRWRLQPKDEAAYMRGELVEPVKPIIIYIDPATPAKWVPYLIAGINDWQKAFEAAGFKNAIIGKPAPTAAEDPAFSMDDARYSVLRYFASDTKNAYGQHVSDPRTGEIIETYIGWYHNEMKDLYDWYLIQTAGANPLARTPVLPDEVMGQLIRYTCSHEVGHTLGLPHNWAANYAYPVDSLRSRTFTDSHGTSASIMDYSRFNYVAQPGDGVKQFSPKIGEYDLWAIKWGYSWFPADKTIEQEKAILDEWTAKRVGNPLYFFGRDFTIVDPRTQSEDVGDNAMLAGTYGIANLRRILPNLSAWIFQKGKDMSSLNYMYNQVIDQFERYAGHVLTNVGGLYINHKLYEDTSIRGDIYVEKGVQQDAIKFLKTNVFDTPSWLIDRRELSEFDNGLIIDRIKNVQANTLAKLLNPSRLARMFDDEVRNGKGAYTVSDLLEDLRPAIFHSTAPDAFTRNLQRKYVDLLIALLTADPQPDPNKTTAELADVGHMPINVPLSDIRPLARAELKKIDAKSHGPARDAMSAAHFEDLRARIRQAHVLGGS